MTSPFKFLDSYTREDREIFFGRDREIEEMYQKVFESKMLLVYGISGTGKTSLINCGLANKFEDSDWLPVSLRRGRNVVESLERELRKVVLSDLKLAVGSRQSAKKNLTGDQIVKTLKSIYLDHFKPIYLIFDQFEELFIFGDREEREEFIQIVKAVVDSDVQCRFIFSIREEYLAGVTEFERLIPEFLANRMRIEKMTSKNAIQVIEGPCKVHNIEVEEGFPETVLEKLSPESAEVELTYLQVFLDKVFRLATDKNKEEPGFTNELLEQVGNVSDLLGSFLEDQIIQLEDPETGLTILKSFVSVKGTKRQISEEEIIEFSQILGNPVERDELKNLIQKFINLRILRDKDESGRYELRHDSLADKIYEKITLVEKELLEVRQVIDNAYSNYEKRHVYLSVEDLKYIAPYEDKLFLNQKLEKFINDSKREVQKAKRRRRNIVIAAAITLIVVLSGFTIWAINERGKAVEQKKIAENQKNEAIKANKEAEKARQLAEENLKKAEQAKEDATKAKNKAKESERIAINAKEVVTRELYSSISNSLSISPMAMNYFFYGIGNPVKITASAIEDGNLLVNAENAKIESGLLHGFGGNYIVSPNSLASTIIIKVKGITSKFDTIDLGRAPFRVGKIPDPIAYIANISGGEIGKSELLTQKGIEIKLMGFIFDVSFEVQSFGIVFGNKENPEVYSSESPFFTVEQKNRMRKLVFGERIYVINIKAKGPDDIIRQIPSIEFLIK